MAVSQEERDGESSGRNSLRSRWAWGLAAAVAFCALLRGGLRVFWGDDRPAPYHDTAVVKDMKPKMVPFRVRRGQVLRLRVTVTEGDPVDVRIGCGMEDQGEGFVIPSAGLRDGKAVRDFELAEEWRHPTAALLIVSTKGRSEVTIDARASTK